MNGGNGPDPSNILLDWESPLRSSLWNDAAITFLAHDFGLELQADRELTYCHETMHIEALRKLCVEKLTRTRDKVREAQRLTEMGVDEQNITRSGQKAINERKRKADRLTSRRRSVSTSYRGFIPRFDQVSRCLNEEGTLRLKILKGTLGCGEK